MVVESSTSLSTIPFMTLLSAPVALMPGESRSIAVWSVNAATQASTRSNAVQLLTIAMRRELNRPTMPLSIASSAPVSLVPETRLAAPFGPMRTLRRSRI